ncbi:MAG: hypothetical protein RJQ21_15245 [Rhodospirillales bacterium]
MHISETLEINSIFWIRSIPDNEIGPTRRIIEDLNDAHNNGGWPIRELVVGTSDELVEALNFLADEAEKGVKPIIHFDAHGSKDKGILLSPSGEHFSWDKLANHLRIINCQTMNNLICIFATCYGYHINFQVELKKPTPSYLIMAPTDEISVGFLEEQTVRFYQLAHASGNVTEAFSLTLASKMKLYHCQGIFFEALSNYIRYYCSGKSKSIRYEKLLSDFLIEHNIENPSPAVLKNTRNRIKSGLKPSQKIIEYYASKFLICRRPAFDYDDLEKFTRRR